MRKIRILVLFVICLFYTAVWAANDTSIGIAAIVDDQVISTVDLNDRVLLTMGITGIPDTPENRARLAPQMLRQLIEEKLQMEEAGRDSISISDARLHAGIAQIEKQSNKPPGSLEQFLESKGLSKLSFYAQVRAQIAWSEIILKKVRPKIRISDQEVARYVARSAGSSAKAKEVQIAVILLPVDAPKNEMSVKKLADKLVGSIRAGSSFDSVAAQFSASVGTKASEPFWVELSQMDPIIANALAKTHKDGITDALRTGSGYQIVKFINERDNHANNSAALATTVPRAELAYKQILMKLKTDAKTKEAELLLTIAQEVARAPGKCTDKKLSGVGGLEDFDFTVTLARAVSSDLPDKLRDLLMGLSVGGVSKPVATPQGIHIFMLCERMDLPPQEIPASVQDETIRRAIFEQKIELEAQKFMRDLRREAFVEIRLK